MDTANSRISCVELECSLVPPTWEVSVRTVATSEHRAAALSLAHAFAEDDVAQYLVVSEDTAVRDVCRSRQ